MRIIIIVLSGWGKAPGIIYTSVIIIFKSLINKNLIEISIVSCRKIMENEIPQKIYSLQLQFHILVT